MAEIKQLKEGDKTIYPLTSTKAIVDENGNRVTLATTDDLNNYATNTTVEAIQKKELQLSVKDNGNIILSNANGESKEFMPATPSGDPMHYAYENMLLAAEYNNTDTFKIKRTIWSTFVDSIEYKAKWDLDIVDASLVQPDSLVINGVIQIC